MSRDEFEKFLSATTEMLKHLDRRISSLEEQMKYAGSSLRATQDALRALVDVVKEKESA